jgi:hypothetical protein
MKLNRVAIALLSVAVATLAAADLPGDHHVTPAGEKLAKFLDATDVEHLWLPHEYVDWKTGEPATKPTRGMVKASHCSAYAAAVADRLGVYLLRPPAHGQGLLANAQYTWLGKDEGTAKGWKPVKTPEEAQADANGGQLVVVVFKAPDPKEPGHIAVVHPAVKTTAELEDQGPDITQAGAENHAETTVSVGFSHHPGAWDATGHGVKFFAHAVAPDGIDAPAGGGKR